MKVVKQTLMLQNKLKKSDPLELVGMRGRQPYLKDISVKQNNGDMTKSWLVLILDGC